MEEDSGDNPHELIDRFVINVASVGTQDIGIISGIFSNAEVDLNITVIPTTDMDIASSSGTSDLVTVSVVIVVLCALLIIIILVLGLLYSKRKQRSVESVTYYINHVPIHETESAACTPHKEGSMIVGSVSLL